MLTLTMTKGLPASGKTTWAKQQNAKRVNKDDLRAMIDDSQWSKANEKGVLAVRDMIIRHYLTRGHDVIVDDTNLAPKHLIDLQAIAQGFQCNFEIKDFTEVSVEECVRRDANRPNYVGEKVIRSMYNSFLKPKPDVVKYSAPVFDEDLPTCIIVDIDGTIAHMTDRSPYDYTKVSTDVVDPQVREIMMKYAKPDVMEEFKSTYIIIVSGREDSCEYDTRQWLAANQIPYDELHMRSTGDLRNDTIIKREIYDKWINGRYNVRFVLDDRDRVVKMWRDLGLKVLQVAEGDF